MNLFNRTPEPAPVNDINLLRRALKVRNKTAGALPRLIDGGVSANNEHLGRIPNVSPSMLEAFLHGADNLNIAQLQALTKALFPFREFNAETGMVQSANKAPPMKLGTVPGAWVNPNGKIAKAQADYAAALAAAREH